MGICYAAVKTWLYFPGPGMVLLAVRIHKRPCTHYLQPLSSNQASVGFSVVFTSLVRGAIFLHYFLYQCCSGCFEQEDSCSSLLDWFVSAFHYAVRFHPGVTTRSAEAAITGFRCILDASGSQLDGSVLPSSPAFFHVFVFGRSRIGCACSYH